MRNGAWVVVAAAATTCVLGGAVATVALAQDAPAAEPQTGVVKWFEGWEAGKAVAGAKGKLMLVYVHRTSPP